MLSWKSLLRGAAFVAGIMGAASASSQAWPTKPVTLVIPFAAGGPVDQVARALQQVVQPIWKQPLVVENRPGAGGAVGTAYVAQAAADGYTILINSSVIVARLLMKDLPYNPDDLRPIVELGGSSYIIVANPSVPAKNLRELVAHLKQSGTAVNTAIIPNAILELDAHRFNQTAGTKATLIPFNSSAQIITALLRNDVNFYLTAPGGVAQLVDAGKLTAIAITSARRNDRYPNVPTTYEQGVPYDAGFAIGVWVSAKTPEAIIEKISADMAQSVLSPQYTEQMKKLNYDVPEKPREYPTKMRNEMRAYSDVVNQVGLKPQ